MKEYQVIYTEFSLYEKPSYVGEEMGWKASGRGQIGCYNELKECKLELLRQISFYKEWFNAECIYQDPFDTLIIKCDINARKRIQVYKIVEFNIEELI